MPAVLGVNAVFHDPAAAVVVDGTIVAAAEEERFSRRKHGKPPVAFSTWELPEESARFCLDAAGVDPSDVDAVAYSYDPSLLGEVPAGGSPFDPTADVWEPLRSLYTARAPLFLQASFPGLRPGIVRHVPRSEEHTSELQSRQYLVCRLLLEKKTDMSGTGSVLSGRPSGNLRGSVCFPCGAVSQDQRSESVCLPTQVRLLQVSRTDDLRTVLF